MRSKLFVIISPLVDIVSIYGLLFLNKLFFPIGDAVIALIDLSEPA